MPRLSPTQRMTQRMAQQLDRLEAESDIRRVLARYMHLCDQPCDDERFPQLGDLFTADAIWEGVGPHYANKFGRKVGRDAVVAHVAAYLAPSTHFKFNIHLLTSEAIRVDEVSDKNVAYGQWIMQQVSTYEDDSTELILARLNIEFRCPDGAWQMHHFCTERLMACPVADARIAHLLSIPPLADPTGAHAS